MNAVIFDHDGVLVDSEPLHRVAWEATFGPMGVIVSAEDYAWSIGRRDLTFAQKLVEKLGLREPAAGIVEEKHRHLRRLLRTESSTFDGVPDLVRRLAEHHLLGIASSAMRAEVDITLPRFGMAGLFQAIVTSEDVNEHKPHPEPYLHCAAKLGVAPTDCVVFEDSVSGIQAARAAGMSVVAFASTFPAEQLADADAVLKRLDDVAGIAALVDSLARGTST